MNKLQLYIYKSMRGFKSVRNINPEEDVQRHILDVRLVLDKIDYDPAQKYLFYLISYIDEGAFFTILRTIPGQKGDHLATSIFVPAGLRITPAEMEEVVHRTTLMISNPAVSAEDLTELHQAFAKEYPVDRDPAAAVASEGREYAVAFYGPDMPHKLSDWYGPMLYQPQFLKYAGVLLVDSALQVKAEGDDVSDVELLPSVAVLPPKNTPEGFTPHIYHHQFDRPFLAPLGGTVEIVWRRSGFEDRSQEVTITHPDQEIEATSTAESRKAISPASFFITAQASKAPVADPEIYVNGVEIREAHYFTQADLKSAEVVIKAPGYFPFKATLDLASTTQALIQLQEQRKIYRFEMPVRHSELGAPIRFEIHTKRALTDSPLEGYALQEEIREGSTRINHLRYTGAESGASRRNMIIFIVAALLVGLIAGWLMAPGGSDASDLVPDDTLSASIVEIPVTEPAKTTPAEAKNDEPAAVAAAASSAAVTKEAIAYLDDNKKWSRDELEKFPELKGLFDDMNHFRIERIINVWKPKLSASKNFTAVATAADGGRHKPKAQFKPDDVYNSPDDYVINWRAYTYRVDP